CRSALLCRRHQPDGSEAMREGLTSIAGNRPYEDIRSHFFEEKEK
ncbi:MAG: hypothetical protein ACI8P2_005093, partial [Candidatus Latescibacterota bacterium]